LQSGPPLWYDAAQGASAASGNLTNGVLTVFIRVFDHREKGLKEVLINAEMIWKIEVTYAFPAKDPKDPPFASSVKSASGNDAPLHAR
jgi:hypothetical protein